MHVDHFVSWKKSIPGMMRKFRIKWNFLSVHCGQAWEPMQEEILRPISSFLLTVIFGNYSFTYFDDFDLWNLKLNQWYTHFPAINDSRNNQFTQGELIDHNNTMNPRRV